MHSCVTPSPLSVAAGSGQAKAFGILMDMVAPLEADYFELLFEDQPRRKTMNQQARPFALVYAQSVEHNAKTGISRLIGGYASIDGLSSHRPSVHPSWRVQSQEEGQRLQDNVAHRRRGP